uniref:Uncharacterized protein n=1 Tax=Pyxicephalus adspersus TaxID=30357 RepID=A0AAV3A9M2_PYXAD|nr:TPA: hypothetical protein GDO54_008394 [Pyxicephalus adspersus]
MTCVGHFLYCFQTPFCSLLIQFLVLKPHKCLVLYDLTPPLHLTPNIFSGSPLRVLGPSSQTASCHLNVQHKITGKSSIHCIMMYNLQVDRAGKCHHDSIATWC